VEVQFVWLVLGIIFLLPFIDPRHPLRLLHLDLLVLVGSAAPIMYPAYLPFGDASVDIAIGSAHLGMAYLVVRMLRSGFRPGRRSTPLIPVVPVWSLAAALAPLVVLRLAYVAAADPALIDTGGAGVLGADRILNGESLYGERFAPDLPPHTDTYGVFLYLAYVPFELILPVGEHFWQGGAQRAAAVTFDVLTMAALFLLGRRLRGGAKGTRLGVILAFAWASFPYTFYVMTYGFNDALVSLLLVCSLLVLSSPPARGLVVAVAAGAKYAPAALAPLFATGTGERRSRSAVAFGVVFLAIIGAGFAPFVPDGGPSELFDRTLRYQQDRTDACCTLWVLFPGLDWLQVPLQVAVAVLALAVAFVPRHRSPVQIAALGAAILLGVEMSLSNWNPWYIVWFAPFVFVAWLAADDVSLAARREVSRAEPAEVVQA
jgi:glycosyl transferase family 87